MLIIFVMAWLPRVWSLDAFVTPDERKWLARSANFTWAIAHGDFAHTFQREHPGVTVMWAGMLGIATTLPDYASTAPGYFAWEAEEIEEWLTANTTVSPLQLLTAGRWWVVLAIALAITVGFLPLRRLLGEHLALLATAFVALAPFEIGLSRQLHPDGLVSVLSFLTILFFLAWLYGGRRNRDLVISGIVMGLAWLTKTPAAFLVPVGAILIGLDLFLFRRQLAQAAVEDQAVTTQKLAVKLLTGYVIWGVVATLVFFALWPAMWVDPIGTFGQMTAEMEAYVEGHVNPNFFLGMPTGDPGALFYPIAYLWRITPAVLIGLAALPFFLRSQGWPLADRRVRRTLAGLLIFALFFMLAMTVPAKKFDRYILPSFLALDVLAAVGWMALVMAPWSMEGGPWLARLRRVRPRYLLVGGVLLLHANLSVLHVPYYLTYFNPLVGGGWSAPRLLFTGWGEGLDEAARWLNQQPEAEKLRVVSWYADGPFSYFFHGTPVAMGYGSPLSWLDTDYVVTYVNQWQRQLPSPEAVAWFDAKTPVHTVRFGGIDLARIYDLRQTLLPPFIDLETRPAADFGGKIRLVGQEFSSLTVAPGESVQATFYLQGLAPMERNYNMLVRVVDAQGDEHWRAEGWPWGAPTGGWPEREVRPDGRTITLPPETPAGLYQVKISFYDPETLENLAVASVVNGAPLAGDGHAVALLTVSQATAASATATPRFDFGDFATLRSAAALTGAVTGDSLAMALEWAVARPPQNKYTVFVHLVGPDNNTVAQRDAQPLNGFAPTNLWTPGLLLTDSFVLELPPALPAGQYEVRVGLYDGNGRVAVAQDGAPAGDYALLGTVELH